MIKWTYGKCHVCGFDGDQHGTSMHQCWSDRSLLEKIADSVGVLHGSEPPSPFRESHYREALESAAKMLEDFVSGPEFGAGFEPGISARKELFDGMASGIRDAARMVRSHKVKP